MAGGGQAGTVVCQVEVDVEAAGEQARVEVGEQAVGAGEDFAGGCAGGGVDGGTDLAHEGGGIDVVALDVADGGGRVRLVEADEVVEVASDVHAVGGREVAGGQVQAGDRGQGVGQQSGLQAVGELVLGVVEAGAFQGLGDQPGDRREDGAFFRGEGVGPVVGEHHRTDGAAGGSQRQECPGGHVVLEGGGGIGALQIGEGGEEGRNAGGQDVYRGSIGGQGAASKRSMSSVV